MPGSCVLVRPGPFFCELLRTESDPGPRPRTLDPEAPGICDRVRNLRPGTCELGRKKKPSVSRAFLIKVLEKTKSINIDARTITLATLEVNIMAQDLPGKNKQHNPDRDQNQDPGQGIF